MVPAMRLQLTLSLNDLTEALGRLTPLELHLDDEDDRVLLFEPPAHVELVPGLGLRAVTAMRIRWPILGIEVAVRVESAVLLLIPELTSVDGRDVLVFSFRVEEADLQHLPAFIDERVVEKANRALASDAARLRWRFLDALSFELPLPERMRTRARTFDLHAAQAMLEITNREVVLTVTYGLDTADAASDSRSVKAMDVTGASDEPPAYAGAE